MFGKVTKFHGSGLIEAEIIASGLPATMPTTSDGIDNLGDGYTLAPGSTMIVTGPDKKYILGDDGTWEEYSAGGGGASIQVTSLPTASASLVGTIYQYVGTTSGSTINSHFYKCVEGSTSGTYEWVDTMDSTPTENSKNPVTSGGVYDALQTGGGGGYFGTVLFEGTLASGSTSVTIPGADNYDGIIIGIRSDDDSNYDGMWCFNYTTLARLDYMVNTKNKQPYIFKYGETTTNAKITAVTSNSFTITNGTQSPSSYAKNVIVWGVNNNTIS